MTGMRHKAVLVLGCLLVAVALAACGGGPSEAEIEATVVARIDEKQAEDAALEAKAHAMAKAMVEATAQEGIRTHTPDKGKRILSSLLGVRQCPPQSAQVNTA